MKHQECLTVVMIKKTVVKQATVYIQLMHCLSEW